MGCDLGSMEFIDSKNVIIRGFVALLIPIIFYWRVLSIVLNEALFNDSTSHILAVPFLIGYMLTRNSGMVLILTQVLVYSKSNDVHLNICNVFLNNRIHMNLILFHNLDIFSFYSLRYYSGNLFFFPHDGLTCPP